MRAIAIVLFLSVMSNSQAQSPFFNINVPLDENPVFSPNLSHQIDIVMDVDSIDALLAEENRNSNHLYLVSLSYSNDTATYFIDSVGIRLRGNTSRNAVKKSLKLSFNSFVKGRKFFGLEKWNINGQQNDPSISRAKICTDLGNVMGIPTMRTSHLQVSFNGEYIGLFTHVEHIDEHFVKRRFKNNNGNLYKCLYPADLLYKGNDPDVYKEEIFGRRPYEMHINDMEDDYSDLAEFIRVLNHSPIQSLQCDLEKVFNVDSYLKAIVFDVLTGNWDGPIYNKNNFYLYQNTASDLFEYIPYDLDNTLGIDWINRDWGNRNIYSWDKSNEDRPIYTRILEVPEYRDRYSFYMRQTLNHFFNLQVLKSRLDALKNFLNPLLANDILYPLDFGFTLDDFDQSFDTKLNYPHTAYGIKPFITERVNSALQQLDSPINIKPFFRNISSEASLDSFQIQVQVLDDQGLASVALEYRLDKGTVQSKEFQALENSFYTLSIESENSEEIEWRIKATDDSQEIAYLPNCGQQITSLNSRLELAINEIMADNKSTLQDEAGEYEDWIELYNFGSTAIYLGDKYLSDKNNNLRKWQLPDNTLMAGEYFLIYADEDGSQGENHANFKLNKNGETLSLVDSDEMGNSLIDQYTFAPQSTDTSIGRIPNGVGSWEVLSPSPGQSNNSTSTGQLATKEVYLFPNPSSNWVELHGIKTLGKIESTRLLNLMGQPWEPKILNGKLNIQDLNPGMYIIQINLENEQKMSMRFLKI